MLVSVGVVIFYHYEYGSSLRVFSCVFEYILYHYERGSVICIAHYYEVSHSLRVFRRVI